MASPTSRQFLENPPIIFGIDLVLKLIFPGSSLSGNKQEKYPCQP